MDYMQFPWKEQMGLDLTTQDLDEAQHLAAAVAEVAAHWDAPGFACDAVINRHLLSLQAAHYMNVYVENRRAAEAALRLSQKKEGGSQGGLMTTIRGLVGRVGMFATGVTGTTPPYSATKKPGQPR